MANSLSFDQVATLMTSVLKQVRGVDAVQEINLQNYAAIGTTILQAGYDQVLNSISTTLTKTYFSIRPYAAKFTGLYTDRESFGIWTRKLSAVDKDPEDNSEFVATEGATVPDQYASKSTKVLQMNFYGGNTYSRSLKIYKDQLNSAFTNANEGAQFWSMLIQNMDDMVQQDMETEARMAIASLIAGVAKSAPGNVIHLVTKYNDKTGAELTSETVHAPENWPNFVRWLAGYLETKSQQLTERTRFFHANVTGKEVSRHTPLAEQKLLLLNTEANSMNAEVLSTTFHDGYLKTVDYEPISFWQGIDSPSAINGKFSYLDVTDGSIKQNQTAQTLSVFGVLFDKEAVKATIINDWSQTTPINARLGYSVLWTHYTARYGIDFTENCLVFCLD